MNSSHIPIENLEQQILRVWEREFNPKNNPPMPVTLLEELKELIESQCGAAAIKELEKVKFEMKMHTVPEGRHLITRSYLNNTIDFMVNELSTPKEREQEK